jgi:hypothetical protein
MPMETAPVRIKKFGIEEISLPPIIMEFYTLW